MIFCLLLWLTARGAATGDGNDISVFTHLSVLDANSSCSMVGLARTDDGYSLDACTEHTEFGDYWCHIEIANDTEFVTTVPKDNNLICAEQVMFVTSPYESWLYRIHPSNFTFLKTRPFKRGHYGALAFSYTKQRLFFCYKYPGKKIGSRDFDDANEVIHVNKIYCDGLAVDDINSIVFFIGFLKPVYMIFRLKDDGYEIVKRMHFSQVSVAVHPGSKTIFTTDYHKITSVDYHGKNFRTRVKDSGIHSLGVVPGGDMLYYGTNTEITLFDLKTQYSFVTKVDFPYACVMTICVYGYNRVIMSCTGRPHIIIFDPKTKHYQVHKIKEAYTVPLFTVRDCYSQL